MRVWFKEMFYCMGLCAVMGTVVYMVIYTLTCLIGVLVP